jgi:WD40 repeat protein
VLIWNSVPTSNGQPADVVLGQPDFTSAAAATTQTGLYYPCGVIVSPDGRLIVAEYYNNRVLIWNSIPTSNGAPADVVIGQPNFTSSTAGNQADRLSNPWGVNLSPDGKLLITNTGSNQVFIYDSIPETNGESATHVIGHNQFGLSTWGVSDSTLFMPVAATVTPDGKVAIGDFGNNRVLIYNQVPSINGEHADVVLGQPSFTSSTAFAPTGTADTNNMRSIYNVSTDLNGRIFVSGRDMHRVLVFGDLPTDSADLSISISESSSSLCDSSNVVYRIKILNLGPDTSENIVI